nr:hypothetical protein [Tanacetum cinerariifolium]
MAVFSLNQPSSSLSKEDDVAVSNSHVVSADEVAKGNYKEFGDIYKMVFVPFTAIDNHMRSVTTGSGLLKKETAEAYGWLLKSFKKAFVHAPNIVVTDQDEAMRLAVAAEFPESKHRLCMWHIMQKIPSKIVWNMFSGPEEFEHRWNKLVKEFNLVNHMWLSRMYRLRSSWILAFFVDSPLCGLLRTTSRSKSENSFFSYFTSSGSTLVKFMLCYESAMERQRHTQEKLDHQPFDSFPTLLTPLPIEEHVAKVYTHNLFIRVQKEIIAWSWLCLITNMSLGEGCTVCIIDEEKVKLVGLPELIDKESTSKNVKEEIICIKKLQDITRNNEPKLSVFVNKMKAIKSKLKAELPIVLTRTVSNFVQEFMGVMKPDKVKVKNPTGVRPKGLAPGDSDHVDGRL